jgi:hypothetical protein
MKLPRATAATLRCLALGVAAIAAPCISQAADFALIMGIGNYQQSRANLPGIDKDLATARRITQSIGVPASNIRELNDSQVSQAGVAAALREMESALQPGDRAFIYYSGHGAQVPSEGGGSKCTEGMFVYDMKLYKDFDLEASLARIANKAGQLIMFNDSCFSGGAATKAAPRATETPKFYKSVVDRSDYSCGEAVNMKSAARSLIAGATAKGNNFVYIAAAADDEVAMATPNGSAATLAWEACLRNPATDSNGSGTLSAGELESCAQRELGRMGHKQTITTVGNKQLPVSFAAAAPAPSGNDDAARRSAATLEDIRQSASPAIRVELITRTQATIGGEPLEFSVRSSKSGYLYLLHVGSDGRTFNLLFPNDLDSNNYIQAGSTVQLPRPSWRVRAGGPVGESHVMAIVSDTQKNFRSLSEKQGPFKSASFTSNAQKSLFVEAANVGGAGGAGQFGASRVVSIREVQ